jgi:hypothetical protein
MSSPISSPVSSPMSSPVSPPMSPPTATTPTAASRKRRRGGRRSRSRSGPSGIKQAESDNRKAWSRPEKRKPERRAADDLLRDLAGDAPRRAYGAYGFDARCAAPPVAFDEAAASVVAHLYALRGARDASGAERPTPDDVGGALIRAAGDRARADETSILDAAVPELTRVLRAFRPDAALLFGLLRAMELARGALCQLHDP